MIDEEFLMLLWNTDTRFRKQLEVGGNNPETKGYYQCLQDIKKHLGLIWEEIE